MVGTICNRRMAQVGKARGHGAPAAGPISERIIKPGRWFSGDQVPRITGASRTLFLQAVLAYMNLPRHFDLDQWPDPFVCYRFCS